MTQRKAEDRNARFGQSMEDIKVTPPPGVEPTVKGRKLWRKWKKAKRA